MQIIHCENFNKEFDFYSVKNQDLKFFSFTSDCRNCFKSLNQVLENITGLDPNEATVVIGSNCMSKIEDQPAVDSNFKIVFFETCFHAVAPGEMVNKLLKMKRYIVTPFWLESWKNRITETWGFDQKTAREFFSETTKKIVLIDTTFDIKSRERLTSLGEYLDLPVEYIPLGISFFHFRINEILSKIKAHDFKEYVEQLQAEKADYAFAMDMLSKLSAHLESNKVHMGITRMFSNLFASNTICYWKINDKTLILNESVGDISSSSFNSDELKRFVDSNEKYLIRDGIGFLLKITYKNDILSVVSIENVEVSSCLRKYLNLAINVSPICALAIIRASEYEKLVKTENELQKIQAFLPICCKCHKIRNDAGSWDQIEQYISERSNVKFSHGFCPECFKEQYL